MKRERCGRLAWWVGFGMLVVVVIAAVVFCSSRYLTAQRRASVGCASVHVTTHVVVIRNNAFLPAHVAATRCDRLTVKNEDNVTRIIAFGMHDHHVAYDGMTERLLTQGQQFSVTLDKSGSFRFHDHLHDELAGTFTVIN